MKKIELLSPAGNMESFYAAIHAGADAVYLAGKSFGARAFAKNFSNEELIEIVNYAHMYGVKVYVTVNTVIFEDEIHELTNYLEFLYLNNVDAVIVQDLGVINIIKQKIPELEIHASTQMNTHNNETLKYLKSIGVKRVVFARETSLEEINNMDVDIEREIFIHGALCISYSGQCLLSEVIGGRSGNRGLCAGPCRLEYKLIEEENGKTKEIKTDGKYLLSTKDLCSLENLEEILKSNVDSLKIEGRMKSKEYIYLVTSIYRKAIDNYYKYGKTNITEQDILELKKIYNREFTKGYLFNENKNEINNSIRPNHQGINVGKVISSTKNRIKIKLSDNLNRLDGIRIISQEDIGFTVNKIYKNNKAIEKALAGDVVEIDCNKKVKNNSIVVKTTDIEQINNVENLLKIKKRISINMKLVGKLNDYLKLTIIDNNNNKMEVKSSLKTSKASNVPITKERMTEQLSRLNDTPFIINNLDIEIDDNIFIPIKEINNIRREAIEKLINARTSFNRKLPQYNNLKYNISTKTNQINMNAFVKTEEQLKACIEMKVNNIYVEEELYNKYKNQYNNLVLSLPRIIKKHKEYNNMNLLVRELGSLKYSNNNKINIDYTLNITNSYALNFINNENVNLVTLSVELKNNLLENLLKSNPNINTEMIIYGNIEVFISKYCVLNKHVNKKQKCSICKNNSKKYYLVDRKNEKYQIISDGVCNNILLSSKKINKIEQINFYKTLGINNFRLNFYDENYNSTIRILKSVF